MQETLGPVGQPPPSLQRHNSETSSESSTVLGDPTNSSYYPPVHHGINPSVATTSTVGFKSNADSTRYISRTPSPTPSEAKILKGGGLIDWKAMMNWKFWLRKDWILYYVIATIFIVILVLVAVYDKQIVRFLQPAGNKIRDLPAGFLIPIAIFFILSFPPLFGHEILAILVGLVYGLWIGFAITAAGTYVGEVGNFYAFKYFLRKKAVKWEKDRIDYACLARIVRDGGVKVAIVARFSAIPGHFTTAIFSTCGMSFWVFSIAAIVTLPKQFVTVYLGYILEQEGTGKSDSKDKIVSYTVFAITTIVTIAAVHYLRKKIDNVKVDVVYGRRKARQLELEQNGGYSYSNPSAMESGTAFNPRHSDSDLPLNPGEDSHYQRWDVEGRAVGYAGDPRVSIQAPAPQRPATVDAITRLPGGGQYSPAQRQQYDLPEGAAQPYPPDGSGASQPQISKNPYMQARQDSVDSVGWDTSVQGAYKLPSLRTQSPLSTGLASYAAPSGPPPHLQQPPVIDPYASGPNFGSTAGSGSDVGPVPPPLQPPPGPANYPQYAQYQSQQQQMPRIQTPTTPRGQAPTPPSTQQYASYGQTSYGQTIPSPHDLPDTLPSPQFPSFGQPITTGSNNGGAFNQPGAHVGEASMYYTPSHSRVGTEDGPADVHTPTNPETFAGRTFSPPPTYRT